uniref:Uncharacterized protein n=1 Tax=Glossina brevipalpis TaxID=37001 RepID=A0A1A9WDA4_9MUSC
MQQQLTIVSVMLFTLNEMNVLLSLVSFRFVGCTTVFMVLFDTFMSDISNGNNMLLISSHLRNRTSFYATIIEYKARIALFDFITLYSIQSICHMCAHNSINTLSQIRSLADN